MADQSLLRSRLTPAETQAIWMVLDGLPSEHSRRACGRAGRIVALSGQYAFGVRTADSAADLDRRPPPVR